MLSLSRKPLERIRVGDVVITVLQIRGGRVKLGIDAPPDVPIDRFGAPDSVATLTPKDVPQEE